MREEGEGGEKIREMVEAWSTFFGLVIEKIDFLLGWSLKKSTFLGLVSEKSTFWGLVSEKIDFFGTV